MKKYIVKSCVFVLSFVMLLLSSGTAMAFHEEEYYEHECEICDEESACTPTYYYDSIVALSFPKSAYPNGPPSSISASAMSGGCGYKGTIFLCKHSGLKYLYTWRTNV